VQDGINRARFREALDKESFLEPGVAYLFRVGLQATAYRFKAGHRLRLEIASSNFPKYDRNLNRRELPEEGAEAAVAQQTVYHGPQKPSRLRLTVLPGGACERLRWARARRREKAP
jgi:predicted acyl esterase